MSIVLCLGIAYLIGVNIAGFTLLHIQKKERAEIAESIYRQEQQRLADEEKLRLVKLREEQLTAQQQKAEGEASAQPDLLPDDKRENEQEKKKEVEKVKKQKSLPDFSLLLIALTGGGLSVYLGMFFMKYKLKNLLFMLVVPLCIGFNVWLAMSAFTVWFV